MILCHFVDVHVVVSLPDSVVDDDVVVEAVVVDEVVVSLLSPIN